MKERIIKAKTYKAIATRRDNVHLKFHTLVDERMTTIFGDVSAAPAMIGQEWTHLKESLARQKAKQTMWERVSTPQINEAEKKRDEKLNNIIGMVDVWINSPGDTEINNLGRYLRFYLKRLKLLKGGHIYDKEIPTGIFCRWTINLPEYITAVQVGKIQPVVEELMQVNAECDKLLRDRFSQLLEDNPEDIRDLCKQTNNAYRKLINQINETILKLTILTEQDCREQASQTIDLAKATQDKECLVSLISLLNADVSHYEYLAAEEKKNKEEKAEARRIRREQGV